MFKSLVVVALMVSSAFASAQDCTPADLKQIDDGLVVRMKDKTLPEDEQQAALFARITIANERKLQCRVTLGVAGNIYDLVTRTHKININFVGSTISNLALERTGFN